MFDNIVNYGKDDQHWHFSIKCKDGNDVYLYGDIGDPTRVTSFEIWDKKGNNTYTFNADDNGRILYKGVTLEVIVSEYVNEDSLDHHSMQIKAFKKNGDQYYLDNTYLGKFTAEDLDIQTKIEQEREELRQEKIRIQIRKDAALAQKLQDAFDKEEPEAIWQGRSSQLIGGVPGDVQKLHNIPQNVLNQPKQPQHHLLLLNQPHNQFQLLRYDSLNQSSSQNNPTNLQCGTPKAKDEPVQKQSFLDNLKSLLCGCFGSKKQSNKVQHR